MLTGDWDDFDDDVPCLARQACIERLIQDAPEGCLYCQLAALEMGDDD